MPVKKDNKYVSASAKTLSGSSLENFARKVLEKLIADGVPPIPYNYQVYFLNELDNEDPEFRKHVYELISIEESNDIENDLEFEIKLKTSFKYSKDLLNKAAIIYKLNKKLTELLEMELKEANHITNNKALIKLINNFKNNLKIIENKLVKELEEIKNIYSKNIEILKEIESNSIYDAKYGVYNKNYFINEVKKELKLIKKFHHISSIIILKIKDEVLNKLSSEKSKVLVNRSLAKIMLKTSRRTDIVARFEDNIFAMLLKHTDVIGAQRTVERLSDAISNASIFLEGEEVELKMTAGIVELRESDKDAEIFISKALEALKEAENNDQLYIIGKVE